jgi:putative two-component system response regulator
MPAESNSGKNKKLIDAQATPASMPELELHAKSTTDLQEKAAMKCRILILDPDLDSRRRTTKALADLDHVLMEAGSTAEAFEAIAAAPADLIIVDTKAPQDGGLSFCQSLRKNPATQNVPVFIQASAEDHNLETEAFSVGADEFLVEPLKPAALRARVHATLQLKSMMESLDNSETVLFNLAKSVEDRDPDLGQHCQRLALMASAMGLALDLPPADIRSLQHGGYLHDIGKIGIPDRVLFKAGPLTPDEWQIMRSHAERGERICACMKSLAPVLPIIRHHHEKFDGTGYPDGLKGEQIPLLARILQVVDIYDALTTERPYKRAYTPEEALAIMREETQKGWRDPALVEVFADLVPVFHNPSTGDTARLSLQSLADSLEKYRKTSLRQPVSA